MGFSLNRDDAPDELSEINVTPFIDVMLVLLIIFMVAAPLATVDIAVDLPGQSATAAPQREEDPIFLTLTAGLALLLGDAPVNSDDLPNALARATAGDSSKRLYLRADAAVPYGALMEVMEGLRQAGYLKIALVAQERGKAPEAAP